MKTVRISEQSDSVLDSKQSTGVKENFSSKRRLLYAIGWVLVLVCTISPLELFLKQRSQSADGDNDSEWSFGQVSLYFFYLEESWKLIVNDGQQILAVVSVIPSVVSLIIDVKDREVWSAVLRACHISGQHSEPVAEDELGQDLAEKGSISPSEKKEEEPEIQVVPYNSSRN